MIDQYNYKIFEVLDHDELIDIYCDWILLL